MQQEKRRSLYFLFPPGDRANQGRRLFINLPILQGSWVHSIMRSGMKKNDESTFSLVLQFCKKTLFISSLTGLLLLVLFQISGLSLLRSVEKRNRRFSDLQYRAQTGPPHPLQYRKLLHIFFFCVKSLLFFPGHNERKEGVGWFFSFYISLDPGQIWVLWYSKGKETEGSTQQQARYVRDILSEGALRQRNVSQ